MNRPDDGIVDGMRSGYEGELIRGGGSPSDPTRTPFLIPTALCGLWKDVKRMWVSIVRKAVKHMSWEPALKGIEYIPVEDAPGAFILRGPSGLGDPHVLLFALIRGIKDVTLPLVPQSRDRVYLIEKLLILSGLDMPWFCLASLGFPCLWILEHTSYDHEKPQNTRDALRKILRYWDLFCGHQGRFCSSSPHVLAPWGGLGWGWGARALGLCKHLPNVTEKEVEGLLKVDAVDAGAQMRKWVGM